ncbi:hypothetical protein CBL_05905 [Carabus blaptoides fortunei]
MSSSDVGKRQIAEVSTCRTRYDRGASTRENSLTKRQSSHSSGSDSYRFVAVRSSVCASVHDNIARRYRNIRASVADDKQQWMKEIQERMEGCISIFAAKPFNRFRCTYFWKEDTITVTSSNLLMHFQPVTNPFTERQVQKSLVQNTTREEYSN